MHAAALAGLCLLGPPRPAIAPLPPPFVRVVLASPPKKFDTPRARRIAPPSPLAIRRVPEPAADREILLAPDAPVLAVESTPPLAMPTAPVRLEAPLPAQAAPERAPLNVGVFEGPAAAARRSAATRPASEIRQGGFANALAGTADGKPSPAVRAGGFGSAAATSARPTTAATASAGFSQALPARAETRRTRQAPAVEATPVEILSKPKPAYTDEARERRIEGNVVIEVRFGADGRLYVLRVLQGLGSGLDEAAADAVREMSFRPATRGGAPVDTVLSVSVAFRLAY